MNSVNNSNMTNLRVDGTKVDCHVISYCGGDHWACEIPILGIFAKGQTPGLARDAAEAQAKVMNYEKFEARELELKAPKQKEIARVDGPAAVVRSGTGSKSAKG